jgi:FHS family L-fucose permease-like MFS transporter
MLLIVASTVIFIYGMLASMLGTIVPSLATRLALSNAEVGYLALAQGLGLAVTSVGAGALMDRSGKKVGIVIGLCASIIGLLTLAHSQNLLFSVIAMAVLGCGGSLVIVGSNAIANDVSDARKATALNVLNVFVGLGGLATPFVAGNLLGADSTRIVYAGAAISIFALVLTLLTKMRGPEPRTESTEDSSVFGDRTLYVLSLITFLYTACEFAIWNWLPKYLIAGGMASTTALNILSLGFACGILVGRLVAARVLVKASPLATTIVAALLMGMSSFAMLHASGTVAIASLVFLLGLCMAPVFPTTIAIVGRRFKQRAATAIGFTITCGFSGLVVSSPIIGWISGPDPRGIHRGLMIIPLLSVVLALTLLAVRSTLSARPTEGMEIVEAGI